LPDGRSFLYHRLQKLPPGAPATEVYQKGRIYLHKLGTDPDTDKPVFGFDLNPNIKAVVETFAAQKDALYVQTLDGGNRRIWRVDYQSQQAETLELPYEGSASLGFTPTDRSGIFFNLVSWTKSNAFFFYKPSKRTAKDTKFVRHQIRPANSDRYVSRRIHQCQS
jgi:hypothetical protein